MAVKNTKTCPDCSQNNTRKRSIKRGIIRYFCNNCNTSFSLKRRPTNLQEIIFLKVYL